MIYCAMSDCNIGIYSLTRGGFEIVISEMDFAITARIRTEVKKFRLDLEWNAKMSL
jgi:hypothetical protein